MEPAAMEPAADADNTLRIGDMVYFTSGRFVAGSLEAARYKFIISIGADGDVLVNKFDEVLMPDQLIRRVQRGHLPLRGKWQPHTEYDKIPGDDFTIEDADAQQRAPGPPTGAAGASAGVFSSPPRRARLNLARNPLSAGGVWGLRVWVCGRTLENRPWSPPLLPAVHSPLPSSQKTQFWFKKIKI